MATLLSRARCAAAFETTRPPCARRSVIVARAQSGSSVSRRDGLSLSVAAGLMLTLSSPQPTTAAIGFKKDLKKKKVPLEDYTTSDVNGLKYFDMESGRGPIVAPGDYVTVHFDCIYKGLDVVSSRSARLLGGNRTIAEPFEFVAGEPVAGVTARKISDAANGLFSGSGGPKPPPALSTAVLGMKQGGKRSVIVDVPDLGYGVKGVQEIPPNGQFELKVEVLNVSKRS